MHDIQVLNVADSSSIGEVRRYAVRMAERYGFDEETRGKIAIVATELASNLVKHGGEFGGEIAIDSDFTETYSEIRIIASDRGPGMANVHQCMQDGYSTSGTVGGGLGAISRLPDAFDIFSRPEKGTVIYSAFKRGTAVEDLVELGSLNYPYPGEDLSGDASAVMSGPDFTTLMVADGLGHGPDAHDASRLAVQTFQKKFEQEPAQILEEIHRALSHTRGAAVAVARINHRAGELTYSGLGNISGMVLHHESAQTLMTLDGIVGQIARRFHTVTYPWNSDSILVMHSDGLSARVRLDSDAYPGILNKHPQLIASLLMRDARRGKDDATVLVAKGRPLRSAQQ